MSIISYVELVYELGNDDYLFPGRQPDSEIEPSMSVGVTESYSEIFEEPSDDEDDDDEMRELRPARDALVSSDAKLGYTWT